MSQDLFKLTLDQLRITVKLMDLHALKSLYEKIIQWKRCYADKTEEPKLLEMLRKQSIIHREFSARKLTEKPDFLEWQRKMETRMTRDGRIN